MESHRDWLRRNGITPPQGQMYLIGSGWEMVTPPAPPPPSKDWSKIETYWPHLAKQGGTVAPRRAV